MFKNPFSFEGRIRRTEFGLSVIIYALIGTTIELIGEDGESTPIIYIAFIPLFWFVLAQGVKRCHDRGNSGWYQIIPYYGLWMLFANSEEGINEYGPNPKGLGNPEQSIENP